MSFDAWNSPLGVVGNFALMVVDFPTTTKKFPQLGDHFLIPSPTMSVQRRLLHWTRALRHGSPPSRHSRPDLPAPTSPEPLGLSRDMQRVSLDPKSYPVGTRRNWNVDRPSSLTTTPLGPNNARLTPQAVAPQVWRTVVDNPKLALRLGLTHRTPIPNARRSPPLSIFPPNFRRSGVLRL